jgi:taurine dioxygenase
VTPVLPASLDWRPITPQFGAELNTGQIHQLDGEGAGGLLSLIADRGVVVARGQTMTIDEQVALGHLLGPVHVHPVFADPDRPEVLVIHADEKTAHAAGERWHSDVSCQPEPPAISMLRMEIVPESGGDTLFADMYRAYQSLSPALQNFLPTLTARHDAPPVFGGGRTDAQPLSTTHPVVRTHPLSNRRALYVNSGYTKKIVELTDRESEALLRLLFDQIAYNVDHQIRVRWQPGTVVLWDNRCVQHHAAFDYYPAVRHGYRITTIGEAPIPALGQ